MTAHAPRRPVTARSALIAHLGARLLDFAYVDDGATTTKVAVTPANNQPPVWRCDGVASLVPGSSKIYAPPAATARPWWHATGGPANDPHIEIAGIFEFPTTYNTGLEALFTAPPSNRVTFFWVAACNQSGTDASLLMIRNAGGNSVAFRARDCGMNDLSWNNTTSGQSVRTVYADSSLETIGPVTTPAKMKGKQWRLYTSYNAATGNLLEINGNGTTPQHAQSKALFSATAQTHINIGDTSPAGTSPPRTKIKAMIAVADATLADVAAVETWAAIEFPDMLIESKASIGLWGNSQANQTLWHTLSSENYINPNWHFAGGMGVGGSHHGDWVTGSANHNAWRDWIIRCDPTRPVVSVVFFGENEAIDATRAANFRTNWEAIVAGLDSGSGRSDTFFCIVRLGSWNSGAHTATVRGHQDAWVAANPTRARLINVDDETSYDGIHYDDPAKVRIINNKVKPLLPAIYP